MTRLKGVPKHAELEQELIPCACGCGELIERYYKSGDHWHERYYVRNHHRRGVPASELQKSSTRAVSKTQGWKEALQRGIERRALNPSWHESTTSDAARQRWTRRKRGERRSCICEMCGKEFERRARVYQHTRDFCSYKCSGEFHRRENHPFYSGGKSVYPLAFNRSLKRKIRVRDGNACQLCGTQHKLIVHHIDCDKSNCAETNLITLCSSCHARVHIHIRRTGEIYRFDENRRK